MDFELEAQSDPQLHIYHDCINADSLAKVVEFRAGIPSAYRNRYKDVVIIYYKSAWILCLGTDVKIPIRYCPYCGIDLSGTLRWAG